MDQSRLFSLVEMAAVYAIVLTWAGWELWQVRKRPDKKSKSDRPDAGATEAGLPAADLSEEAETGHPERQKKLDP